MAIKKMAVKLTPKQQLVINQLLIDPGLKLCAEVTGLSYGYIRRLVTKSNIIAALEQGRRRVAEKAEIDATWVLLQQVEVFSRCMEDVPVLGKDGNPIGIFRFDASGANRALENIGKHNAVNAFTKTVEKPVQLPDVKRETVIIHTSKEEYDKANGKPPIENRP